MFCLVSPQTSTPSFPTGKLDLHLDGKVLSDLSLAHELKLSAQEAEAEANRLSNEHLEDISHMLFGWGREFEQQQEKGGRFCEGW